MSETSAEMNVRTPRIALAGNPNCGKTCMFNLLTGANQEVGNFPGVTVEYTAGKTMCRGAEFDVIDLPGTYSLTAYSLDEVVTRDYLLKQKPEMILNVVDASNLDRQLYLTVQLLELGLPMVMALNMMDVAERHGIVIDVKRLSSVLGIPVIPTRASEEEGVEELKNACYDLSRTTVHPKELSYSHELEGLIDPVEELIVATTDIPTDFPPRWLALKLMEHDSALIHITEQHPAIASAIAEAEKKLLTHSGEDPALAISEARLGMASGIVMECVKTTKPDRTSFTDRIDSVVCNRYLGPVILAGVVYLLFTVIFGVAEDLKWIPMPGGEWVSPCGALAALFDWMGGQSAEYITNPTLLSLVRDAVISGVGGVLEFVPLIFMMFLFIAILEDTGYIARVAFIMDRLLRVFGLQGKSILAMIVSGGLGGGGCAVPGILSTRTLREEKDRYVTMMVAPMMNCGAKLPLYALLSAAFFPNFTGGVMFVLWVLSWGFAMTAAVILRKTVFRGEQTPFIMELPVYHVPTFKGVLQHTWMRTWQYIKKAGTIILMVSISIWALMFFPAADTSKQDLEITGLKKEFQEKTGVQFQAVAKGMSLHKDFPQEMAGTFREYHEKIGIQESEIAQERLRNSFAGRVGSFLTPVTSLAGFDWKVNVALLGGFAAKEIVVGTLATAYSMGGDAGAPDQGAKSLTAKLASAPGWSPLKAFALMVFVMLYAPCAATVVVIRKESNSWKWPLFSIVYSTLFAFLAATLIYRVGGLLLHL